MALTSAQRRQAAIFSRTEPTTVFWEGADVTLAPYPEWRSSTNAAWRSGNFEVWAQAVLDEESYDHWVTVDPDLKQVNALWEAWMESGADTADATPRARRPARK